MRWPFFDIVYIRQLNVSCQDENQGKFSKGIEANRSKARRTNVLKARSCMLSAAVDTYVSQNMPELSSTLSSPDVGNASSCISSDHSYTHSLSFDFINETDFKDPFYSRLTDFIR